MIIDYFRYLLYSYFFRESNPVSTIHGYDEILKSLPDHSTVLDVGCGSGIYFTSPKVIKTIKSKNLKIKAIDIDLPATMFCYKRVIEGNLADYVRVEAKSIMDEKERFDYVLWMESYPVIEKELFQTLFTKSKTLAKKKTLMYHNLIDDKSQPFIYRYMKLCKPLIKYFTLVDFGRAVRLEEMENEYDKTELILSCKYGDLIPPLKYIPVVRNLRCNQYAVAADTA